MLASRLLSKFPRYQEVDYLGCGSSGYTILALDKACGDRVAIKVLQRTSSNAKYVEREAGILKSLVHPHIILLKEVLEWQDLLGLVMEYASGGTLYSVVLKSHGLSEADARWYFQQIVVAADFCHKMGVACRDVKLENVLLVSKTTPLIKLCDFGCSKDKNLHSPPGSLVGTPVYLAPEVALSSQSGHIYNGQMADVWSLGILLFAMLAARYPFGKQGMNASTRASYLRSLLKGDLEEELHACIPPSISNECRELLLSLLQPNPDTRSSLQDVFRNPWFMRDLPEDVLSMNERLLKPKSA